MTIGDKVTFNGKAMWIVKSVSVSGDVCIYRFVDTKNRRRMVSRYVSPLKLKEWGK
jgi:hypothetical protein